MSESNADNTTPKTPKLFSLNNVKSTFTATVYLPKLYEGYKWDFVFRLKLSAEAEEQRQLFIALSAVEQTERTSEQALNEVCDLLVELPTGFAELQSLPGQSPGKAFRSFYEHAGVEAKEFLNIVIEAADSLYWSAVTPREFRQ